MNSITSCKRTGKQNIEKEKGTRKRKRNPKWLDQNLNLNDQEQQDEVQDEEQNQVVDDDYEVNDLRKSPENHQGESDMVRRNPYPSCVSQKSSKKSNNDFKLEPFFFHGSLRKEIDLMEGPGKVMKEAVEMLDIGIQLVLYDIILELLQNTSDNKIHYQDLCKYFGSHSTLSQIFDVKNAHHTIELLKSAKRKSRKRARKINASEVLQKFTNEQENKIKDESEKNTNVNMFGGADSKKVSLTLKKTLQSLEDDDFDNI